MTHRIFAREALSREALDVGNSVELQKLIRMPIGCDIQVPWGKVSKGRKCFRVKLANDLDDRINTVRETENLQHQAVGGTTVFTLPLP